ncbi:MAG: tripartite tricarboxylate transporter permease [Oscillospiraceae bacterium]
MLSYLTHFDPAALFTLNNIVALFVGGFVGMLIGALPGLGAAFAMVMLLPFTYNMEPISGILLLLSGFQAANYGGSISSIILSVPGTPGAVVTLFDGAPMAKKNMPGKALAYSLYSSTIGGIIGALIVLLLAQPIATLAMQLATPEYFLIAAIGLCIAVTISAKDLVKGLMSVMLGLAISTMGTDMFRGIYRFTQGSQYLTDGVHITAMLIGVFALPEIIGMIGETLHTSVATKGESLKVRLSWAEFKGVIKTVLVSSLLGTFIGTIPGLGSATAPWITYPAAEKMSSTKGKTPFGTGNPEGIASAEAANNAGVGGELIPLMVFGIPSTPVVALVLSAFIIHGIKPGPAIFTENPSMVCLILVGFMLTTIVMYLLGHVFTPIFVRALVIPTHILIPMVLMLSVVGVFAADRVVFDVLLAVLLGALAFFMAKVNFSLPGFVLAYVLGKLIEENYRRTLMISGGSLSIFVTRPQSVILICIFLAIIGYIVYFTAIKKRALSE